MHKTMPLAFGYLIIALVMGCASDDVDQVCRPELQIGCNGASFCSITRNGASLCLPETLGRLSEGSLCESFDDIDQAQMLANGVCGPGLGCIQDGLFPRCLRFCDTSNDDPKRACQGLLDATMSHGYGEQSECTIRVQGRNEIGLCRLPCRFGQSGESAGCPEESTCGLSPDAYFARCLPEGEGQLGGACDASCPCAPGLVCVTENQVNRCREARTVEGCGDARFARSVLGTKDDFLTMDQSWVPYEYCTRCIQLSFKVDGRPLWLCAGGLGCEATDNTASLHGVDTQLVTESLENELGSEYTVVVNLESREGQWFWPEQDAPVEVENSSAAEGCPSFTQEGVFTITETCSDFHLCQTRDISSCGTNVQE